MDIIEKTFTSTLDFIKEIQTFKEKFVYRGHSDESYRLVPTFCRLKNNKNSNALFDKPPNWVSEEGLLIDNFKKSALPNLKIIPTNFLEWITVAQHYGLPTRLLDWTLNPLIALFFAVENLSDSDCVVYALKGVDFVFGKYGKYETQTDLQKNIKTPVALIYHPSHYSNRITMQQGCFIINVLPDEFDKFTPLEDQFTALPDDTYGLHLFKFKFPGEKKVKIKIELDNLGINASFINPDLDGLSKKLIWDRQRRSSELLASK